MKLLGTVEQRMTGNVVIEIPDEVWEAHPYFTVRRKLVKKAVAEAVANGAAIIWNEPWPIEAQTGAFPLDDDGYIL